MSTLTLAVLVLALDASAATSQPDVLTLPVSAVVAGGDGGAVEKAFVAESVAALREKRDFAPGEPDVSVNWDRMEDLPDLKDFLVNKQRCGSVRNISRLRAMTLRGAAILVYLQRKSALEFAERDHKAASAYLKAASASSAASARATGKGSTLGIDAENKEAKLRRDVESLRKEIAALEAVLITNGWAREERGLRGRRLSLGAKLELDYTFAVVGRC